MPRPWRHSTLPGPTGRQTDHSLVLLDGLQVRLEQLGVDGVGTVFGARAPQFGWRELDDVDRHRVTDAVAGVGEIRVVTLEDPLHGADVTAQVTRQPGVRCDGYVCDAHLITRSESRVGRSASRAVPRA